MIFFDMYMSILFNTINIPISFENPPMWWDDMHGFFHRELFADFSLDLLKIIVPVCSMGNPRLGESIGNMFTLWL